MKKKYILITIFLFCCLKINAQLQLTEVITGLNRPSSLLLNGNDLYIAEFGGDKISKIDITATNPTAMDVLTTGLDGPLGEFLLHGNDLYIADFTGGKVVKIDITATNPTVTTVVSTGINLPSGLALSGNDLYISDYRNGKISKIDITATNPTLTTVIADTGGDPFGLLLHGNDLYIAEGGGTANGRILKMDITATNSTLTVLATGLGSLRSITLNGNDLYVTGISPNKIVKMDITATTPTITNVDTTAEKPFGVFFKGNDLYFTELDKSRVVKSTFSIVAPTVATAVATSITNTTVTLAGNATADGSGAITERGIVYSKTTDNSNPVIGGSNVIKTSNGTGTGMFSASITGLALGTEYTFKAYATNSIGPSYGEERTFTTTGKEWLGTTSDWATPSNWSGGAVPTITDDIVISNGVPNNLIIGSTTNAVANNIAIENGGFLEIESGGSLTIEGNLTQNGTFTINSNATTNGSLIVNGTSTGNVIYKRYLTTSSVEGEGWHLVTAPVSGQDINTFSSSFLTSQKNNKSIASYNNNVISTSRWEYYTTSNIATSGDLLKAKGYSMKIATAGTLDYTGTLNVTGETIAITDGGDAPSGNRWNLIGNPYTASLKGGSSTDDSNSFLRVNIDANKLDPARAGLYLWNGSSYVEKAVDDDFFIAPGQAFFVHAPNGGGTSVSFTKVMRANQTGNIFLKNSTGYPEIILKITDKTKTSSTKIRYLENKTTSLDVGSDVGVFTGVKSDFNIFTHLIDENKGVKFAIQALPNSNYENMVVPVGVNAKASKEISFSLEASNFPSQIRFFLEDRSTNTFTRIDNNNYKVRLTEDLNGVGRFYIHTTNSSLSVDQNRLTENINIYKLNNTSLRIIGLKQGDFNISIFNVLGKRLLNSSFTLNDSIDKDISLPKLTPGIYIVQLQINNGKLNKKIILE